MRSLILAAFIATSPLSVAFGATQNYDVKIEGMTCDGCVKSISAALSKIPSIDPKSVKVVLKENKAHFTVTDDKKESIAQIKKAIEDGGFTVTSFDVASAVAEAPTKAQAAPAPAAKKN